MTKSWRRAWTLAGLTVAAILVLGAVPVQAGHNPQQTKRCTYEVGVVGDGPSLSKTDPVGATADGALNVAGCFFEFPDASGFWLQVEDGIPIDGEYTSFQVSIVDDVFGTQIGGELCSDTNGDAVCGELGNEVQQQFCGTSPVFEATSDTDGDGHEDFGNYVAVWVNGPLRQATVCDPAANPVGGTTGGVLNPSGGIFMALGG